MFIGINVNEPLFVSNFNEISILSPGFFFEKYSNTNFHENPSGGSRVVRCGQTDRHAAANSRFSQFCEGI
jgi:hypothetical protein